jgi:antirestriction protein
MRTIPAHGIYVSCLASYNNGDLYGIWIDLDGLDKEDILEQIKGMIDRSPTPGAEEYAVHDYSGIPGLAFGEYPNWDRLVNYVAGRNRCSSPAEEEAWSFYGQAFHDLEFKDFQEDYRGCHETAAEYAMSCFEDDETLKQLNPVLMNSIHWDEVFQEMRYGGDIWSQYGKHGLHVFSNR